MMDVMQWLASSFGTFPKVASENFHIVCAAVGYCIVSISLTLYNKWTLSSYGFHFPITLITCTFTLEWFVTLSARAAAGKCCLKNYSPKRVTWATYRRLVVPIAVCSALEISWSNISLLTLSVAFHTMVKSTTPVFVLLFSFVFGLQEPKKYLFVTMFTICGGLVLCTYGEVDFDIGGFFFILGSAVASGIRWSLSQLLLQSNEERLDPVSLLFYALPVCVATLPPFWLGLERSKLVHYFDEYDDPAGHALHIFGIAVVTAALAYILILVELYLVQATSSITTSVVTVTKELILIMLSVKLFGDELTPLNIVGFSICIAGVGMFKYHKYQQYLVASKSYMIVEESENDRDSIVSFDSLQLEVSGVEL